MFCASLFENCVIRGDENCELYSLLFQTAVYHIIRGHRVTFICDPIMVDKGLPLLNTHFKISHNERILKSIMIKYCTNLCELTEYFTHFYLYEPNEIPHVVIIHDIISLLEISLFTEDSDNHHYDDDNDGNHNEMEYEVPPDSPSEDDDNDHDDIDIDNDDNKNKNKDINNNDIDSDDDNDDEDFVDEHGKLDYGIKLANFLPILHETQHCVKQIMAPNIDNNNNNKNKRKKKSLDVSFLSEMICIVGMECTDCEFNELYPFWRYWGFERFLYSKFDSNTNIITIKYDTEELQYNTEEKNEDNDNDDDDDEDDDIEMNKIKKKSKVKKKGPPAVFCYVGQDTIDMITRNGKKIKKKQT